MSQRKWPNLVWMAGVLIAVPLLYVLCFGPACWWWASSTPPIPGWPKYGPFVSLRTIGFQYAQRLYWPLGYVVEKGPRPMRYVLVHYALLNRQHGIFLPTTSDGGPWLGYSRDSVL